MRRSRSRGFGVITSSSNSQRVWCLKRDSRRRRAIHCSAAMVGFGKHSCAALRAVGTSTAVHADSSEPCDDIMPLARRIACTVVSVAPGNHAPLR